MRLIVAITGATGAIFGIRLLEKLRGLDEDVETHLVMSKWARVNIATETDYSVAEVEALADVVYQEGDQGAALSSGSFRVDAMVVVPCSMRTTAAIRHGLADTLIVRAADVVLKEQRPLCLVPRETPLNQIHLENMLALARMGVRICPPMPAFYHRPRTLDDMVDHVVVRVLDQLGLSVDYERRWAGLSKARTGEPGRQPDTGPRPTLMWEAAADDSAAAELRRWADHDLRQSIRDGDPAARIEVYHSHDGRVVVIATGDIAQVQPPTPPPALVRRPPHVWRFVRDDGRPSDDHRPRRRRAPIPSSPEHTIDPTLRGAPA
ncbi:polyprenyl P-hydroxybenzoate/phenylacrylic acid decarboxylase-like protein [Nocardia pseudobrasiliensis]|uniref:Probable UbiX-like flavin prenyltransferase n=1 Tax=Nocardia pseudobrasiliensis TaxID=45979 RepID=A0A370ICQ4_9NOCA|nr:polyprenyl P-hydroxybenzoate/phenylacrylic acid decarboxylase-like protein [Nocardia pseudobrasiliensis]